MARVTVEDCLEIIPNRFELSVLTSFRAKQISRGVPPQIESDNDKSSVVALREVAAGCHNVELMRKAYIASFRNTIDTDEVSQHDDTSIIESMNMVQIEDSAMLQEHDSSDEQEDDILIENYGDSDDSEE